MTIRVKVCCIASVAEAELAVRQGAAALGLVSAMPSGPGPIPEERIAEIARMVPPGVAAFLLTSRVDPAEIAEQQRRCGTGVLQLVDRLEPPAHGELRRRLPGVKLVQVVHVTGPEALDYALLVAPGVDALLLDSGRPDGKVRELGGTGRTHDWRVSRRVVEEAGVPVFLAGGLHAGNVARAVQEVGPFGVDLCSGVRTGGALDAGKLRAFMDAVRTVAQGTPEGSSPL